MGFASCCRALAALAAGALALPAQTSAPHVVSATPPPDLAARAGADVQVPLRITIRAGYHINSDKPADEYLIPTALTWSPGSLALKGVAYPKAESVKYEFSEQPLLVFSGTVTLNSRFSVAAGAPKGPLSLAGKVRYQACNDKMCLPPRTLDVSVPLRIE